MNVDDFEVDVPEGDMLLTVFNYQRDLMDKYHYIEMKNLGQVVPSSIYRTPDRRWDHAGPLDINDRASQLRIKDFCWRVTEEITEATCAINEPNRTHFDEELIDALHFMVELMCLCDIEPSKLYFGMNPPNADVVSEDPELVKRSCYFVVERLGEMANTLKLKPWKTTAIITDTNNFKVLAEMAFAALRQLLELVGFDTLAATTMYLKKNAVNKFRQRTNY